MLFLGLLALATVTQVSAGEHNTVNTWSGVLQYDEDWGYVDIRAKAHSFWWLYSVKPADSTRPLFVWLQGGPGSSSTGFGNFEETGPKTVNGTDNPATWLQVADLVYVDNPVGSGFSYVDDKSAYTTDITQIGQDLLAWLRKFLALHPEYRTRPFYIFCESYGGKMSAQFAKVITDAIKQGSLQLNFRAVALGDSWISASDYVNTWGPYLYANSFLDDHQLTIVNAEAAKCQVLVDEQKWQQATNCWGNMENLITVETHGVSWYNILKKDGTDDWSSTALRSNRVMSPTQRLYNRFVAPQNLDSLSDYMDTVVRKKLGIIPTNVKFGAQAGDVFNYQEGDFMTPIWGTVDQLLKDGYNVVVYNGNEDLICNTMGTAAWVNRLTWDGANKFNSTTRHSFKTDSFPLAGYYKTYKNFQFWWILRAGHMRNFISKQTLKKMDPLKSDGDDNYQNIPRLPYENMDPNARPNEPPPPPPTTGEPPKSTPPDPMKSKSEPQKPPKENPERSADQQESDPSVSKKKSKKKNRIDKAKIKKFQGKLKRTKIICWLLTIIWLIFLVIFIILHLNTFGIHLLPFLSPEK